MKLLEIRDLVVERKIDLLCQIVLFAKHERNFSVSWNINRRREKGIFSWGNFCSLYVTSTTFDSLGEATETYNSKKSHFVDVDELFLCSSTQLFCYTTL